MIEASILYRGTVQGVGFRYTVHRYATDLDLNGWVKNLADGNVEIGVEGNQFDIESLCQRIEAHFPGYVRDKEVVIKNTSSSKYKTFEVIT